MIGKEGDYFLVNSKTGKHTGPFTSIRDAGFAQGVSDGSREIMDYTAFNNYFKAMNP